MEDGGWWMVDGGWWIVDCGLWPGRLARSLPGAFPELRIHGPHGSGFLREAMFRTGGFKPPLRFMAPAKRHSDFIRNPRSSISRPPISGHAAPTRSRRIMGLPFYQFFFILARC